MASLGFRVQGSGVSGFVWASYFGWRSRLEKLLVPLLAGSRYPGPRPYTLNPKTLDPELETLNLKGRVSAFG